MIREFKFNSYNTIFNTLTLRANFLNRIPRTILITKEYTKKWVLKTKQKKKRAEMGDLFGE